MNLFVRKNRTMRRANHVGALSQVIVALAAVVSTILLATATATTAAASSTVTFDGSPGTNPPPPTLGVYQMTAFAPDPQPTDQAVSGVNDTAGAISFSNDLYHTTVGDAWATWSNNYTGDVYWEQGTSAEGNSVTVSLPASTFAFYFYAEPNPYSVINISATTNDGTTSGQVPVNGNAGAQYFGFYTDGTTTIQSITVSSDTDFAIGEFGINSSGAQTTRYVALGDSVPYGHGLANPYPTPQVGLPASAVQQGPSNLSYPALVATALHLNTSIRSTNCTLTGDDLTISGAAAAQADTRTGSDQCTGWPDSESVQQDELPAAQLAQSPAKLVTIQAGADDIRFGDCMTWDLTKFKGIPFHAAGTRCVKNGAVTPALTAELANVRDALGQEIVQAAQHSQHVGVLNYYQVIPKPADFKTSSIYPGGQVNPVCLGLSNNLQGAYNDAVIVQSALNVAITSAVVEAQSAGVNNVQLVDISNLENSHEMCTGNPALFSGNLMSKSEFGNDLKIIAECHLPIHPASCSTTEPKAKADLLHHVWRAAHPNRFGQQDIARAVESQLGNL